MFSPLNPNRPKSELQLEVISSAVMGRDRETIQLYPTFGPGLQLSNNQSKFKPKPFSKSASYISINQLENQIGDQLKDFKITDHLIEEQIHDPNHLFLKNNIFSVRKLIDLGALGLIIFMLIACFTAYPIMNYVNLAGVRSQSGIIASSSGMFLPNLQGLIDFDTPKSALKRIGFDGEEYTLMFSDEFQIEGRTFWPGDDPYWEAVDLYYWPTGDYEWYDPGAITTIGGNLQITITEEPIQNTSFRSGMLQSWNKFCFTGGYMEVSVQLPGNNSVGGFWPGVWTLGNLGRAGYGASTDGTWPYSYSSCDLGTLKGQTDRSGEDPLSALNSGPNGGHLSLQPGQKLSACTCDGSDHPGPNVKVGRGAPEIDVLEAQVSYIDGVPLGAVAQSAQFAPYDAGYYWNNSPGAKIYNSTKTSINPYIGGVFQEAASALSFTDSNAYEKGGGKFSKYGFEYWPDTVNGGLDAFITWSVGEKATWTLNAAAIGPNEAAAIDQRLISQEPMSIILNLALSSTFQTVQWGELKFPGVMLIDYVRVYQRSDSPNIGCDPGAMPTSDYINSHPKAYNSPQLLTWQDAGYSYPKNSLTGC